MKNEKIFTIILASSLLFAGCSNGNTKNEEVQPTPTQTTQIDPKEEAAKENQTETKTTVDTNVDIKDHSTTPEVGITMYEAIDKMAAHFGLEAIGIENVELDEDDGFYKYEISAYLDGVEYEATIDANTGDILESESDSDDDGESVIEIDKIISPDQAMEAALAGQENAYVYEWELSIDDGRTKYEIDVENGDDKKVDAYSGEVYDD